MLHSVLLFCALRVVEALGRTDEIAGDAADMLKLRSRRLVVAEFGEISIDVDRERFEESSFLFQLFLNLQPFLSPIIAGIRSASFIELLALHSISICLIARNFCGILSRFFYGSTGNPVSAQAYPHPKIVPSQPNHAQHKEMRSSFVKRSCLESEQNFCVRTHVSPAEAGPTIAAFMLGLCRVRWFTPRPP